MIFQGPTGYITQICEVHLQYGNSTTKRLKEVRSKILILLETTGGILFSLEGFQKMPFTIQNFTQGDLHSTGGIQMSLQGVYNSTGGIQLSFLGFIIPLEGFRYLS